MFKKYTFSIAIIVGFFMSATGFAQKIQPIVIKADKPIANIQPTMWGIFFEDINAAADGGIYAELVKNRSFEFFSPFMSWKIQKQDSAAGSILVINRGDSRVSNPRFARITADNS